MKKADPRVGLFEQREAYFFSSGFDSLGELGLMGVVDELDEAAPPPVVLLAPVPLVELLEASAPGAGEGVGAVVVEGDGAAGGVVTVFSSFLLQAARPITSTAAMRSERFMFFPLGEHHTGLMPKRRRQAASTPAPP